MKKFILSSSFLVASCFIAAAQSGVPATQVPNLATEQTAAPEEPKKAKPSCDVNSPKKTCCSQDKKTNSTKSVKHRKHNKKFCKEECCVKKESN
jgi:hypothetical protein